MIETRIGRHKVKLYNSIDDLPIVRFHRFNKMMLVDAGVGSDISDFDAHIERAVRYIRKGDNETAARELENMRQNVFLIMSEQSVRNLSFACLVAEVDGKVTDDLSDEGLKRVVAMFDDVAKKDITDSNESVKKKIDAELLAYFPQMYDDVETKEYYMLVRRRTDAMLDAIINDTKNDDVVEALTERIVCYAKPKAFSGTDSIEIAHDKKFESMCLTIQKETGANAKAMTVLEFYNAYEYVIRLAKERTKAAK